MKFTFLGYPKCSTCKKAHKWCEENGVPVQYRHIVEDNPTAQELKKWYEISGLPLKKFFNTSGMIYKEMKLKDKLPNLTQEEQFNLLATNGMLVKRPILISAELVLVGFSQKEWEEKLL